jgi:glutaredoxin
MAKIPPSTTIYTRSGCPYCTKIKEVYNMNRWSYNEMKLDVNFDRNQFYAEFGMGSTFPQVIISGNKVGGCTDAVKHLREGKFL